MKYCPVCDRKMTPVAKDTWLCHLHPTPEKPEPEKDVEDAPKKSRRRPAKP